MVLGFFLFIILLSRLCSQDNFDPRMVGLNGSYTNLASGYRAIGINPANLAVYDIRSLNVFDFSFGIGNNFFSIDNFNTLSGAHLSDTSNVNYYPKDQLLEKFGVRGLRIKQSFNFPLPGLSMSKGPYAFTSRLNWTADLGLSNGVLQLLLNGNPRGEEINLELDEICYLTKEFGFSYAHSFDGFSMGITLKYLLGLFYMGLESLPSDKIITDMDGFYGSQKYLLRQDLGGDGFGLDVGMITDEFDDGFRFGVSIINLFGSIDWSGKNGIRDLFEPGLSKTDSYLRSNEYIYYNLVMDSISISSFNVETDTAFFYYEKYKVCTVESIDDITFDDLDSTLVVELSNGTYLVPSEGEYLFEDLNGDNDSTYNIVDNYSKFNKQSAEKLKTRQPMFFRLGLSKEWDDEAIIAVDLVTGFMNRFHSSSEWRLSIGAEISRFKNQLFRMGFALGGIQKRTLSLGYGRDFGGLLFDIGISLSGGFWLNSTQGIDFSIGFMRQVDL